jgi:5-methylcytosine-specific restriction endonuclease McrA
VSPTAGRDRSPRARRFRAAVLARDGHRCQIRIPGICTTIGNVVHHTLGIEVSEFNLSHAVAACAECNGHVGKPDGADAQPRRTTRW